MHYINLDGEPTEEVKTVTFEQLLLLATNADGLRPVVLANGEYADPELLGEEG
jgi:hypothetical protein